MVTITLPAPADWCGAVRYCLSAPNSVGSGATLAHDGSTSIVANDFALISSGAPPNQFGVFFYAQVQAQIPFGDGYLCLDPTGSGIFRILPAVLSNGAGTTVQPVLLDQPPAGTGPGAILPGSTWHFQHWYRDSSGPGGSGSNLTDGLSATFCP